MNTLKRMMVALLALLPLATGMAFADTEHGYSRIFVFGGSFMDSGNHFAFTGETAHPPFELITFANYGIGGHHPTNGRTWVEVLAQEMELTEWAKPAYRDPSFGNYAFSFGRARDVLPDPLEPSLSDQVQAWKDNGYCTGNPTDPMNDTLFIVDSGYRDLLDITQAPDFPTMLTIMNDMAASIEANILELHGCGARNLLFPYLIPLEYTPIGNAGLPPDLIEPFLSELYNGVLYMQLFLVEPLPADMNISTVNFFNFVEEIMDAPGSFGFTNVTDACVTPYVLKDAFCKNRDAYFWWDQLHPTKAVHALLAEIAYEHLPVPD
jgi:outer membrane lipase/esterase